MNNDVKQKWLAALRSGEYKQARGRLRREDGYCCLGVLCDVAVKSGVTVEVEPAVDRGLRYWRYDMFGGNLPPSIRDWAGLIEGNPAVGADTLTYYNDIERKTFPEIADLIEEFL